MKKLCILCVMLFITGVMLIFAEPFAGSVEPDFKFYGWSRDGKAAYLEERDSTGYSKEIYFCVVNCVSDEYVMEERFDVEDFNEWENKMIRKAQGLGIIFTYDKPQDFQLDEWKYTYIAWLVLDGKVYYISGNTGGEDSYYLPYKDGVALDDARICLFKLRNLPAEEKYIGAKYVTTPLGPNVNSIDEIASYISPYEKRGVLVIKENSASPSGMAAADENVRFRLIGCHLEYGFEDTAEFRALKSQFEVNR